MDTDSLEVLVKRLLCPQLAGSYGPGQCTQSWGCGENSSVCRTLRQKGTVNTASRELAPELEHHQMQFQGSVSVFERLVLWSIVRHQSQWSVAKQSVVGKCIVGGV